MSYKAQTISYASCSHFLDALHALLLSAGWVDITPQNQDDPYFFRNGRWLKSYGEDGLHEINMHLHLQDSGYVTGWNFDNRFFNKTVRLTAPITNSGLSLSVDNGAKLRATGVGHLRIRDELVTYNGVSGNTVTLTARGVNGTVATGHSAGDHAIRIFGAPVGEGSATADGAPIVEIYAVCPMQQDATAIPSLVDTSTNTYNMGTESVTCDLLMGYGDKYFAERCLIQVWDPGQPHHGKMRWITGYTSSTGTFTYMPFETAPGVKSFRILTGGFLPGASRGRAQSSVTNNRPNLGILPLNFWSAGGNTYGTGTAAIRTAYVYASKDGFVAVPYDADFTKQYWWFAGNLKDYSANWFATTILPVTRGDPSLTKKIYVNDSTRFTAGQKYRILSKNVSDWGTNWNIAPGWPALDPDEIAQEEIVVLGVGSDEDGQYITLDNAYCTGPNGGTFYSYESGAIIAENPCTAVRHGFCVAIAEYLRTVYPWDRDSTYGNLLSCYRHTPKTDLQLEGEAAHASHRGMYRSYHATNTPTVPNTTEDAFTRAGLCTVVAQINHDHQDYDMPTYQNNNEAYAERPWFSAFVAKWRGASPAQDDPVVTAYKANGIFYRTLGVLPFVMYSNFYSGTTSPFNITNGGTYKLPWRGKYQTFRFFKQYTSSSRTWYLVVGPELP